MPALPRFFVKKVENPSPSAAPLRTARRTADQPYALITLSSTAAKSESEYSYSYSESLNVEVTQVDDCQPLLDDPAGDDDDDAGCTSCGVAGESLGGPLTLGLLMLSIGLFGMLAGRRRS